MIGYRFLFPAEEEMIEASLFYDAASPGLGNDFLDDVQQAIDRLCEYPQAGGVSHPYFAKDAAAPFSLQRHLFSRSGRDSGNRDCTSW